MITRCSDKVKWSKKIVLFLVGLMVLGSSCKKNANDHLVEKKYNSKNFIHCLTKSEIVPRVTGNTTSGVSIKSTYWKNGSVIRVKFAEDYSRSEHLKTSILAHAKTWTKYANLKFIKVGLQEEADITIDFTTQGAYSAVGTDSREYSKTGKSSMLLGQLNNASTESIVRATVLHEFGHALGLKHEQYHRKANIKAQELASYYISEGYTKSEEQASEWVKNHFSPMSDTENSATYDPLSIMHYWLPAVAASNGIKIEGYNTELSEGDIAFIKTIYPYPQQRKDMEDIYTIKNDRGENYVRVQRDKETGDTYAFKYNVRELANQHRKTYTVLPSSGEKRRQYTFTLDKLPCGYKYLGKYLAISQGGLGLDLELVEAGPVCRTSVLFSENPVAKMSTPAKIMPVNNPVSSIDLLLDIYDEQGKRYVSIVRDLRDGSIHTYKQVLENPSDSKQFQYKVRVGALNQSYEFQAHSLPNGYYNTTIKSLPLSRGGKGVAIEQWKQGKCQKVLFFEKW